MGSGAVVDFNVRVSEHGKMRLRERLGLPRRAIKRMASVALARGVERLQTTGDMRHYLDRKHFNGSGREAYRVHGEHVYVFDSTDGTFITTWRLPRFLRPGTGAC